MRDFCAELLRRVRMPLTVGICGSFALSAIAAPTAHADHAAIARGPAQPFVAGYPRGAAHTGGWSAARRLGRMLGMGWGDGYHAWPSHDPWSAASIPAPHVAVEREEPAEQERAVDAGVSGGISAFHAPAWRLAEPVLAPTDSVLVPETPVADLPFPATDGASRPPEELLPIEELQPSSIDSCEGEDPCVLPAAVPVEASLRRRFPHHPQFERSAPRTARAAAPSPR